MNIVYFSSKVIDYVQIYLCEIPMYVISLISDAKYVIIQIQEKYTEFRNRRHKDQIKSCCTLKKPLRLCKVISTLVKCVNRKPIEVMFVPQVTALYSLARSFQQASNECISSPNCSFSESRTRSLRSIMHRSTVSIKGNIILIRREKISCRIDLYRHKRLHFVSHCFLFELAHCNRQRSPLPPQRTCNHQVYDTVRSEAWV